MVTVITFKIIAGPDAKDMEGLYNSLIPRGAEVRADWNFVVKYPDGTTATVTLELSEVDKLRSSYRLHFGLGDHWFADVEYNAAKQVSVGEVVGLTDAEADAKDEKLRHKRK